MEITGKWTFCHCVTNPHINLGQKLKDKVVSPNAYLIRDEASWKAVPPLSKTFIRGTHCLGL